MKTRSFALLYVLALGMVACADDPASPIVDDGGEDNGGNGGGEEFDLQALLAESFLIGVDATSPTAPDLVRFRMDSLEVDPLVLGASSWIELRPTASVSGQIVFQRGWPDTYLTTADAPNQRLVDEGPNAQVWAHFTGDGHQIVFAGGPSPESTEEVWIVAASGGDAELLWTAPHHGHTMAPSLASNGQTLAVVIEYDGYLEDDTTWVPGGRVLHLVDVEADEIITTVDNADIARFSPSADRVAILVEGDLYIMNGDGSGLELLAHGEPGFSARNLAWSPEGEWILVHDPIAPHAWTGELVIVDPDSGEQHPTGLNVSQASWAQ